MYQQEVVTTPPYPQNYDVPMLKHATLYGWTNYKFLLIHIHNPKVSAFHVISLYWFKITFGLFSILFGCPSFTTCATKTCETVWKLWAISLSYCCHPIHSYLGPCNCLQWWLLSELLRWINLWEVDNIFGSSRLTLSKWKLRWSVRRSLQWGQSCLRIIRALRLGRIEDFSVLIESDRFLSLAPKFQVLRLLQFRSSTCKKKEKVNIPCLNLKEIKKSKACTFRFFIHIIHITYKIWLSSPIVYIFQKYPIQSYRSLYSLSLYL